ncbi:MAG TPA: 4'-phosphopantetheinyl transferase superfamily protein [Kofleriaceae bacterium]|nr:4'-phosphopantetheinyl transferase superfamily protein [Kofleriaceae bacterium]
MLSAEAEMLARLVPPGTVVAAAGDATTPEPLPAEEAALVARAVARRQREFSLGRMCARRALRRLGREVRAIAAGPRGEPAWPAGTVGSITHCAGFCAAAVAEHPALRGIGIDAERRREVGPAFVRAVCTPRERALGVDRGAGGLLVFSAKESVYKCVSALVGRVLDFAEVELEPRRPGMFAVTSIAAAIDPAQLVVRYHVSADLVLTTAFLVEVRA